MESQSIYRRRWVILSVLIVGLLAIVIDNTVLNVAMKTIAEPRGGLGASQSQLEWAINSYTLVFAGLLFTFGVIGDKIGRKRMLMIGLALFGIASLAAAFAPSMEWLIAARFLMGLGLGAEIVVGYSSLTEFVPPASRGQWLAQMAMIVVCGLPATILLGSILIPLVGWRAMFVIAGVGSLIVWYLRKSLPESPRWLEAVGRTEEAEALMQSIEKEAAQGQPLPAPTAATTVAASSELGTLFTQPLLSRMIVGSVCLITINTLLYGFVTWLPVFFIKHGLTVATSFSYSLIMALGAPMPASMRSPR